MKMRESKERKLRALYGAAPDTRQRRRIWVLLVFCWLALAVIMGRLVSVHLWPAPELAHEDDYHEGRVVLPVARGQLLDRNGVVLAADRQVPTLCADPSRVENPKQTARTLSMYLGLPEDEVAARLTRQREDGRFHRFSFLARWVEDVAPEVLEMLAAEHGPGLEIRYEPMRFYPQEDLAAQVVGFVNRVGDAWGGLELECDQWLRGIPGSRRARKDRNRTLLPSLTLEYQPPQGGYDVYLTLDAAMQRSLERALDETMERVGAPRAMGMLLEPHTGAVLALAVRPTFNPNRFDRAEDPELYKLRALTDVFEPGSAFKIVTIAAVLEHGLVTPETKIDCENGSFNPYGHRITDVHRMGVVPLSTSFAKSSNVAHIKLGALLGPERLEQWVRRFGFGQRCTRELRRLESPGIFRPHTQWSRLTMGSLPMGHEISVTMPQLARAFAAIANGGFLVEPHFVDRVVDRNGHRVPGPAGRPPRRILSEETAATMRELCHIAVTQGTGSRASIADYRVGGKTGTAQMAEPGVGYVPRKYTSVFAGFAPVSDPRVVAVIVVEEPEYGKHYGGYACGPAFREVVRDALVRMEAPKDPVREKTDTDPQLLADADTVTPPAPLDAAARTPVVLEPLDDLELIAREQDGTEWVRGLPDLTGLTMREARERLVELGIPWDAQGAGRVVQQRPAPGTPVTRVDLCRLYFSNRAMEPPDDETTVM